MTEFEESKGFIVLSRTSSLLNFIIFILGWCILLHLYINEKIKPPLFATISHCVFIIHASYYMFQLYISHLQANVKITNNSL
jgi:hypothetical protein